MTVRSKQRHAAASTAKVVDLTSSRLTATGKSVSMRTRGTRSNAPSAGADLISIRHHLAFKATLGIDDIVFIEQTYSIQIANRLTFKVRELLDQEFGHLRVHRYREVFVISHHCMESLVAGLLRVQFYGREIAMPVTREGEGLSDICGIPLSWGAGRTLAEAQNERLKKNCL